MEQRLNKPLLGISLAVAATFIGTVHDVLIKWLLTDHLLLQILFVRSLLTLGPFACLVWRRAGWLGFVGRRPGAHVLRIALQLLAFLCFFYGLERLPLADTLALSMSAPLMMCLLSGPLLHEPASKQRLVAVAIGFCGVLLMVGDIGQADNWLAVCAVLAAAFFYSLWTAQTRSMPSSESTELMVFASALGLLLFSGLFMPQQWRQPTADAWWWLLALSASSILLNYCIVLAFRFAPMHVVSPFDYFYLVWAVIFGWLIWSEVPGVGVISGALLVVASGLYILYRVHYEARPANR